MTGLTHPDAGRARMVDMAAKRETLHVASASAALTCQSETSARVCAVTVATLTLFHLLKAIDWTVIIGNARIVAKSGGARGDLAGK